MNRVVVTTKIHDLKNFGNKVRDLLLIFCIAIGMLADFKNLISEGTDAIIFMGIVWIGIVDRIKLSIYRRIA